MVGMDKKSKVLVELQETLKTKFTLNKAIISFYWLFS